MVLIFEPKIIELINIKKIGMIFMKIKKSSFLSFKLILNLILLINNQIRKKNGISIPICLNKNKNGYFI